MVRYATRQRTVLLEYLSRHHDENLTPRGIASALESEGISLSAVYRNLASLEAEGRVRRVTVGAGREASFQYADAEECRASLHMSCVRCGRTFHMSAPDAELIEACLRQNECFSIDRSSTVLYGTCAECSK